MPTTCRLDASHQRKASPPPGRVPPNRALGRVEFRALVCGLTSNSSLLTPAATLSQTQQLWRHCIWAVRWKVLRNSPPTKSPFRPAPSEARSNATRAEEHTSEL